MRGHFLRFLPPKVTNQNWYIICRSQVKEFGASCLAGGANPKKITSRLALLHFAPLTTVNMLTLSQRCSFIFPSILCLLLTFCFQFCTLDAVAVAAAGDHSGHLHESDDIPPPARPPVLGGAQPQLSEQEKTANKYLEQFGYVTSGSRQLRWRGSLLLFRIR